MIATFVIVGWLALGAAAGDSEETSTRLARVPDRMEILHDLRLRNVRNAFSSRASIAWSEDGRVVAYSAQRGDDVFPVVGDKPGEPYGHAYAPTIAGGRAFFHVVKSRGENRERHWLWVDGKAIGPEDWMSDPAVRPDGKQATYWTQPGARPGADGAAAKGRSLLAQATEKGGGAWSVTRGEPWLDAGTVRYVDGSPTAFAFALVRDAGWTVFRAEKKEPRLFEPCESIESFDLSAGGSAIAYVRTARPRGGDSAFLAAADEPKLFFKGRRVGAKHAIVSGSTVDSAGAHVAYVVTRDEKRSLAVDEGEPVGAYDFVIETAFDPTGSKLAAVVVRGGRESETPGVVEGGAWSVVVVDAAGRSAPKENPDFQEARDLRWDSSGDRLAYAARDELGWRVVRGDVRSAPHADVGPPVFSADGRRLGFGSRDARELWWREIPLP